jgi:hypothetical protein
VSASQKFAWFNLAVVAACLITVLALAPWLGPRRATGGFGILGLMGFSPLFFRKGRGECITDERDQMIWHRSVRIAYAVFWLAFVAACAIPQVYHGPGGVIPVFVLQWVLWCGWIIVWGIMSLAILCQYGFGGADGA